MMTPRGSYELTLLSSRLQCSPDAVRTWSQDVSGNMIATASFDRPTAELVIVGETDVEQRVWAIRFWLDQHRRLRDRALVAALTLNQTFGHLSGRRTSEVRLSQLWCTSPVILRLARAFQTPQTALRV